jgi:hypothetical protein
MRRATSLQRPRSGWQTYKPAAVDAPITSTQADLPMQTAQIIADAAEDSAIRRYRQLMQRGAMDRRLVQLPCGRCGAVQGVAVQDGMRIVAFSCETCHQRTRAQVG